MAASGIVSCEGTEGLRPVTGALAPLSGAAPGFATSGRNPLPAPPYPLTAEQRSSREKAFIDSIDPDAVCRLASQHRSLMPCRMFQDAANGSYNVCYFIEFPNDGTRWVVRIPIAPAIQDVWAKLQSEVATMRYIESKTPIPIPHVHGFGRGGMANEQNPTGLTFLIVDYVAGASLDIRAFVNTTRERKTHFYSQLIDVLSHLRQQEFDVGGSLMPNPKGGADPVMGPSLSIELNELHKNQPDTVADISPRRFCSATDFVCFQYDIIAQALETPVQELSLQEARREVYALKNLKDHVSELIDARWNYGPFILAHSDLRPSNIILDEDLNIQGIIDWEWAATIPRQMFMPPTWLVGERPCFVAEANYGREYTEFYAILAAKGAADISSTSCYRQLAEEWGPDLPRGLALPLTVALRHYSEFATMYYLAIYPKFFKAPSAETVSQFFEQQGGDNGSLSLQVQRHVVASERYAQYLKNCGLFVESGLTRKLREWLQRKKRWRKSGKHGSSSYSRNGK